MAKQDQGKVVAIVSYLWLIGWIVALILNMNKKTPLGSFHVRQSLLILLAGVVGMFVFWIPVIGWLLWIGLFVLWIIGLVYAIQGQQKEIPLIGKFGQQWFKSL